MNDITVLALLVSKAKASAFTMEYISQFEASDIDSDDVDLRFEVEGMETGTNASIVDECGQAAQMITALVEALEKAQQANAAQDDHINQQQDRIDALEKRNAELGGQLSRYSMSPGQADQRACESRAVRDALGFGKDADDVAPIDLRERIDGMKARIAELESRTVTVKLPEYPEPSDPFLRINMKVVRTMDVKAMTAAGIQVIEGDQK